MYFLNTFILKDFVNLINTAVNSSTANRKPPLKQDRDDVSLTVPPKGQGHGRDTRAQQMVLARGCGVVHLNFQDYLGSTD